MTDDLKAEARRVGRETALLGAIFLTAALVAALIWQGTVELPRWQRSASGISLGPIEATKTIGIDAVYLFVSAPIALVLGGALTLWRRRTPTTTVLLIAMLSVGAAALMERFGLWWGPPAPTGVLRNAAVGATAPIQLQVQATGVLLAWPAAALLGAVLVLLLAPHRDVDINATADSDKLSPLPTH